MKALEAVGLFAMFRHQLPLLVRVRALPDVFERARLASVALLAGFAGLSLALVGHLASPGLPLPFVGGTGAGQVLTTDSQRSGNGAITLDGGSARSADRHGAGAAASNGAGSARHGAGNTGSGEPARGGSDNTNATATQPVPVSVGAGDTGQAPGATEAPSTPTQPATTPPPTTTGNSDQNVTENPAPGSKGRGHSGKVKSIPPGHLKHSSTSSGGHVTGNGKGRGANGKKLSTADDTGSSAPATSASNPLAVGDSGKSPGNSGKAPGNSDKVKGTPPGHQKHGS
jgi:hypothetical protein